MRDKTIIVLVSVIIALLFSLCSSIRHERKVSDERDSYRKNTEILLTDVDSFRTRNGELASKVTSLELSKNEFERLFKEESDLVENLRKRNEELSEYIKTSVSSQIDVKTEVRDSIEYVHDTVTIYKVIDWNDGWDNLHVRVNGDEADVHLEHRDSLSVAVMAHYKRFLGFLWKTKVDDYEVDVVSHNPHTTHIDVRGVAIR